MDNNKHPHWVAHATDPAIRNGASSGGFCKAFLTFLVETGECDFVIMTRVKEGATSPESIITNQRAEILARSNSVYEYYNQIRILKQLDPERTYAFIGLPCFVRHIRREQSKGKYRNIILTIGLFCNQAPTPEFKERLLADAGVSREDAVGIDYRHGGQANRIAIWSSDGRMTSEMAFRQKWREYNLQFHLAPPVCLSCDLYDAGLADISAGDPWLTRFERSPSGWTKVICRTDRGRDLFAKAVQMGYITVDSEPTRTIAYRTAPEVKRSRRYGLKTRVAMKTPAAFAQWTRRILERFHCDRLLRFAPFRRA